MIALQFPQCRRSLRPLVLLAPLLLLVALMAVAPAMVTLGLAFSNFDAVSPPRWAGVDNWRSIGQDRVFWIAARNTAFFVFASMPMRAGFAWVSAALNAGKSGWSRAAHLLPSAIPDAAYVLAWTWILNPIHGPVNLMLAAFGIEGPGWLAEPSNAPWVFVLMATFQAGETWLMANAAIKFLPGAQLEAAKLDGAGRSELVRWVIWPALRPWVLLAFARDAVATMAYTLVPTLLSTGGDPLYSTLFLPLYTFRQAVDGMRFGEAAAATLVMWAGVGVPLLTVGWRARRLA